VSLRDLSGHKILYWYNRAVIGMLVIYHIVYTYIYITCACVYVCVRDGWMAEIRNHGLIKFKLIDLAAAVKITARGYKSIDSYRIAISSSFIARYTIK